MEVSSKRRIIKPLRIDDLSWHGAIGLRDVEVCVLLGKCVIFKLGAPEFMSMWNGTIYYTQIKCGGNFHIRVKHLTIIVQKYLRWFS